MPRQSLLDKDALLSGPPSPSFTNPITDLGLNLQDNATRAWLLEPLTCREAAAEVKSTSNALATLRCRGQGAAYIKHGGKVMYRRLDLLVYQQAGRVQPSDPK